MPKIRRIFEVSKGVYGSPRVDAELMAEAATVGRNKMARLMRLEGRGGLSQTPFPGHDAA